MCSEILNVIYPERPISRIDIAHKTGITPATVSFLTGIMIDKNLLYELGESQNETIKAGRRKILLDISQEHSFFIGAEISESFYSYVLTDNTGKIISKKIYSLNRSEMFCTSDIFIKNLLSFYKSLAVPISAIGIALPGHYNKSRQIITNNFKWSNFDLNKIIDSIKIPIFFDNNVNCMALAERFFYSKKNENFIFFHIGRGIHCSYFYNNDIFSKENFLIGEIGHTVVNLDGQLCECGKRGCLQTYTSETWLLKSSQLIYRNSTSTFLHQLVDTETDISIEIILTAYDLGDPAILKLIDTALNYIALTLNNLNMILDSSKLFLHGKIFDNENIFQRLSQLLNINPKLLIYPKQEKIIKKNYQKINGAIGASALCIYKKLENYSFVV
ncbi:ROK family protein [Enterococcus faecalis]|uniref:ROK family protein n=1 Tax=Enterococcus TaxID=1350 RepID=UPI0018CA599F|nr:ROK family protein [Enterococcus faecalis]MBG9436530.1 ROK family protein [Enterococcus faecalis]MBG9439302.1 ROK family protein [Enterococcus faecalis]MBG9442084.1 ROK family protein [Enterococcus faecalis]MCO8259120.1 ROK family protein [Enterococcus faecalis]MCP8907196.1 ROK family protein [Enterococcus faecalis]